MEFVIYLLIILFALFVYHVYSIQFSTRKLPPGPFVSPFGLGVLPSAVAKNPTSLIKLARKPWEYVDMLQDEYGDFFSVQVGPMYSVVITSFELLQEVANMEEYSIKFAHDPLTTNRTFYKELGLIFVAKHEIWVEMRKFTQRTLRDFGFGKRHTMQSAIEAETSALTKEFEKAIKTQGGIVPIRTTFVLSVLNVLWCMVAGQRYDYDDPKLVKMMDRNFAMTKSITFAEPLHLAFSYLKKVFPSYFGDDLRLKVYSECHEFTQSLVQERKDVGMYKMDPQNYIDVFLQKIDEGKDDSTSVYTKQQLQAMLADLLQTGSTTTNGTLNYCLLYLILNPDIQKRCQDEIDSVVPRHLTPTVEDIEKMPFFQACILETHRIANIVPNPIPRLVPKDWKIRGYTIPKGAVILSNHYSVHMDKKYWGDPFIFRPDRFINEKGEFVPNKRVIHFGFGKRNCIGITLANSVIPIFIATLLQRFSFAVPPGEEKPSTEPEIGVSLSPLEFRALITNRPPPTQQSPQG